jgi:putative ABC transport system permease protein
MVPLVRRMVWNERARFGITTCGIACLTLLVLFLGEVYEGVKTGAVGYIRGSGAEVWICRKNSTNLLRSSSFLPAAVESAVRAVPGVRETGALLRILSFARIRGKSVTLFLFGFDPAEFLGPPRSLAAGTTALSTGEMILDRSFAAKHGLRIGDSLDVQERRFRIAGLSKGTNAVVAQYAFTTIENAQDLLGIPGTASFFLVRGDQTGGGIALAKSIRAACPGLSVFTQTEFVENTLAEMKTGVLPILWVVTVLGCAVGITVMTLLLYGSVLEKREDYALLKALGASHSLLTLLVVRKALTCSAAGFTLGFLTNVLLNPMLVRGVPELCLEFSWRFAAFALFVALAVGVLGSWLSVVKVIRFSPAEVFRA